ncbi:polysaccharide deacetylase family protein [Clostridium sp. CAG:571]|nr:polysaccharide deacetylase family protein [Clostridium sp. CAG:571]HJJ07153.1 polysaccharide deacetylase [Clostridiaceae bacterium]
MYDLIVTKKKNNKSKIFIILLIICVILILFSIVGIKKINMDNNKDIQVAKILDVNINIDTAIKIRQEKQEKEKLKNKDPLSQEQIEKISNIYTANDGKRVFLTFDDGPSKTVTPLILDLLKKENIKATFFVLGYNAERNPEILKRVYAEGHYIANHGYSHKYNEIYNSVDTVIYEYNKTEQCIKNALDNQNYNSRVFRFPGGSVGGKYNQIKQEAKEVLKQNNVAFLDWNALSNDSAGAHTKEDIMDNITKTVGEKNNVVILMHDASDKILTYETLQDVINFLKNKGYMFKNLYDVL